LTRIGADWETRITRIDTNWRGLGDTNYTNWRGLGDTNYTNWRGLGDTNCTNWHELGDTDCANWHDDDKRGLGKGDAPHRNSPENPDRIVAGPERGVYAASAQDIPITTKLSNAGGLAHPPCQLPSPARVRSSDFVRRSGSVPLTTWFKWKTSMTNPPLFNDHDGIGQLLIRNRFEDSL
jgi:hypothetical protein